MSFAHSLTSESPSLNIYAPPLPAQDAFMQDMPNVFVIPPEEEHDENPPWCAFDASKAAEEAMYENANIDDFGAVSDLHQQIDNSALPVPRHANRSQGTTSPMNRGYIRTHDVAIDDMEIESWRHQDIRARGLGAEIVEVVKVRRNEGMSDVGDCRNTGLKKSRTFRSRASRALKSIKNVGRASQKSTYSDPWSSETGIRTAKSMDITDARSVPRSSSPILSTRKSLQFSQFFTFSQSSRSLAATQDSDSPSMSHTYPEFSSISPTESASSHSTRLHPSVSANESVEDPTPSGRISPSPTLHRKKSFRERLSILDLHRLFTSSSSSTPSSTSSSSSSDLSESSTGESLGTPTTPRNDDAFSHSSTQPHRFGSKDPTSPLSTPLFPTARTALPPSIEGDGSHGDISLEMKLDSLHFDSLRFDPDEF